MLNRKHKDFLSVIVTYISAFITFLLLIGITGYVFLNGLKLLDFKLFTNPYQSITHIADLPSSNTDGFFERPSNMDQDMFYSEKWGIGLKDKPNLLGKNTVVVVYIHEDSSLLDMNDKGILNQRLAVKLNDELVRIAFDDKPSALSIQGAQHMTDVFDNSDTFRELEFQTPGGGIRGSLITTLYLIGLTLLFSLPIGIGTAIYLNEFAKQSKMTKILRSFIETLTGVPSIIYGLLGLALFVPMTMAISKATGPNLISGALTLTVILLPVIIRTTEESLKVIPNELRSGSLALGANKTQTIFKIVLPNAYTGILTAVLLSIGRIIGESAALIFAVGTTIKDDISIFDKSTSLSVHIYALMSDEPANIELATTIAFIILVLVLALNISIKYVAHRFKKRMGV